MLRDYGADLISPPKLTMYKQSNPCASASLVEIPSYTPGATTVLDGSASICLKRRGAEIGSILSVVMKQEPIWNLKR